KGFYMDLISGECHPCSDCCGQSDKYHEKQCEDSGFSSSKQCREHNLNCPEKPPKSTAESNNNDKDQGGLEALEVVGIVLGAILSLAIIIVVILGRVYGWHVIKDTLMSWFCYCCHLGASDGHGNTMYFDPADGQIQRSEYDPELGTGKSEQNFSETPEKTSESELLDSLVHQQMQSQPPAETKETQRGFTRSFSHPGVLNTKVQKGTSNSNCIQCVGSPKLNKPSRIGYSLVASTELSDEAVFNRNSSESINARCQPRKPERFEKPSVKSQHTSTTGLYLSETCGTSLNGIPQDFQNSLLSKKMSAIPLMFHSKMCSKLDVRRLAFDDFRLLGEEIGLTRDQTLCLGQMENPTDQMITKFYNSQEGSCVSKFRGILEGMKRSDVVDVIDEWVKYEWLKQCNSSTVSRRPQTCV
ncbi:uncharacterized protein LOC113673773, partial [Pocillopora damicornis]|uniref:uncharacterized protein LOC113673773 n=1 Tax=Pocillopora damicornis TaxID=46731 RepID=UPI000F555230